MKLSRKFRAGLLTAAMVVSTAPLMQLDAAAAPQPTINHAAIKLADEAANTWGTFPGGSNIPVWTEARVDGAWSRSATGTTNSSGGYTLPLTYGQGHAGTFEFRVGAKYADGTVAYTSTVTLTRLGEPSASSAGERHVGVDSNAWGSVQGETDLHAWTEVKLPSGTWSRSQSTQLDSNGRYVLPLTYGADTAGTYTYRVATEHDNGIVARSDSFTFTRFGGAATANAASSKLVNEDTNVWGWFQDGAGIDVWSEVKVGDRWSRSQTGTTDSDGKYAIPLTYGKDKAGTYTFRVGGRYQDGHVVYTDSVSLVRKNPAPTTTTSPTTTSGTKYDWMRAAGIPERQWQYADYIVSRESGWNPRAVNPYSGACGLAQAYPCSKLGSRWYDPVVALKWQYNYVNERYGGYAGAYNFWVRNRWY